MTTGCVEGSAFDVCSDRARIGGHSKWLNLWQNQALEACLQVGFGFACSAVEGEADMRSDLTDGAYRSQQRPKMEARSEIGHYIVTAAALLCVAVGAALYGQSGDNGKYLLTSPGGIAFSDFRGYEDWPMVSARTDEVLKVIIANPTSSKRTARNFRRAADGGTRCSTTMPRPASSRPIPQVFQIVATRAT